MYIYRRKFRSQTSDNMDRWKAEMGRVGEEKRRRKRIKKEKVSEERRSRCAKKVGKSRNTVFFQWFVAPEGRKVGSLKRQVRSPLGRWEMKNCTPLWREAHFDVKMYKTHQLRTTFGSWDVEKVHAILAWSTFRSQNVKTPHARMSFRVAGARDCAPCQKWAKREGFVAFPKTMAGVGHWKRICKDAFSLAGAIQETCSSEMLGSQGADFLRRVAFWSTKS